MGRANGVITFKDGFKMYCLYCGTTDVMYSSCYPTQKMAWDMYQTRCFSHCQCYDPVFEDVIAEQDYGGGMKWEGKACRECMTFEGPYEPYKLDESVWNSNTVSLDKFTKDK